MYNCDDKTCNKMNGPILMNVKEEINEKELHNIEKKYNPIVVQPKDVVEEEDDEEEDARPMLRIKPSSGFKKIAKWMHSPELVAEEYVL